MFNGGFHGFPELGTSKWIKMDGYKGKPESQMDDGWGYPCFRTPPMKGLVHPIDMFPGYEIIRFMTCSPCFFGSFAALTSCCWQFCCQKKNDNSCSVACDTTSKAKKMCLNQLQLQSEVHCPGIWPSTSSERKPSLIVWSCISHRLHSRT